MLSTPPILAEDEVISRGYTLELPKTNEVYQFTKIAFYYDEHGNKGVCKLKRKRYIKQSSLFEPKAKVKKKEKVGKIKRMLAEGKTAEDILKAFDYQKDWLTKIDKEFNLNIPDLKKAVLNYCVTIDSYKKVYNDYQHNKNVPEIVMQNGISKSQAWRILRMFKDKEKLDNE